MSAPNPDLRAWLFSLEQIGIKLGLDQIRALTDALGHPDRACPSIIVAGTNGKGSVTSMVERGLRAAGQRTGRYTSPHLVDLEERFAVDGVAIPPQTLDVALARVREASKRLPAPPSFFEATTAAAFEVFRAQAVDVAILEVGLGGRLDATNVVTPIAGAITTIDFDHEQFLGHTIADIAREKAGVVKSGMTVVLSENAPTVEAIVADQCEAAGARLVYARRDVETRVTMTDGRMELALRTPHRRYMPMTLALRGRHQVANTTTAVRLLEEISADGRFVVSESAIRTAVESVSWPARLELIQAGGLEVLIDGAHNPAGARALSAYVEEAFGRRLPMVVGVMRDKDIEAIIGALAASAATFVFTAPASPRAASPADLAAIAAIVAPAIPSTTVERPFDAVMAAATAGSPVVVAGSLYLAGEIRAELS